MMAAAPAGAHPHVFVDSDLHLILNDSGEVTGVDVTWTYDDFFTLLILEDMGLDPDGDGVLTDEELEQLHGFDLVEWPPGFEGDLYVHRDGEKVELARPTPTAIAVEDGRIVASHHRPIPEVPAQDMLLEQYDPTYYVAYTLTDVSVEGPCRSEITPATPGEADKALAESLNTASEDMFQTIELGVHFAAEVRLACEPRS
ncbi:polyphosphate kinase [Allosediminivita pacifica]|nr:polyphosphate kinase [Allosediminivita pacifica]